MPYTVYMKYLGRELSMQETGCSILVSRGGGGGGEGGTEGQVQCIKDT